MEGEAETKPTASSDHTKSLEVRKNQYRVLLRGGRLGVIGRQTLPDGEYVVNNNGINPFLDLSLCGC